MIIEGMNGNSRFPISVDGTGKLLTGRESGYVAGASITNSTADTAMKAAAGAGVRNYVTSIIISNINTSFAQVQLKDGATALGRPILIPATSSLVLDFATSIRGTANTAFNITAVALYAGAIDITVIGYTGA